MKQVTNIGSFLMNLATVAMITSIMAIEIADRQELINDRQESEVCLAMNIYHEARGESWLGQQAVAHVTLNRVESSKYPNTICDVVYQRKQFSWTHTIHNHNPQELGAWVTALDIADLVLNDRAGQHGEDVTGNAVMYHADYVSPYWKDAYNMTVQIGTHIFYAE